ncbi:MAG: FAD-dependent oxidoreductase, partial [Chloroflexi bacterium]|nr:FAD-dependent oxidoreductase [Chloroflexota bacterium]
MEKRPGRYWVEVPGTDYYRKLINCQNACPVHTSAQGYINDVADGNNEKAYVRARQPNPLASTCGRVCNAPCEAACRRATFDAPVAIRALKRFSCERHGVEAKTHLPLARELGAIGVGLLGSTGTRNDNTVESFTALSQVRGRINGLPRGTLARVAVVGAGPAGLTAAHDLALMGYPVTVYEAASVPGGMLRLGVPAYRLPRDLLRAEVEEVIDLGVELKCDRRLGRDFTLRSLQEEGHRAIFLAVGAHKDQELTMEGCHLDGVIGAVDFLLNANMGYRTRLGEKVVVIGGGNVAVDAARSAVRFGDEATLDASRAALRLGAREVSIVYRRSRDEMPAKVSEVEETEREGIRFVFLAAPKRILGRNGAVCAIECRRVVLGEADASGRRLPIALPGSEFTIEASSVILAIGQTPDLSFLQEGDGVSVTRSGTISIDPDTLATTAPGVFAGGDVAFGPRIIIEAVRDGHRAARSIHEYVQGRPLRVRCQSWMAPIRLEDLDSFGRLDIAREEPPTLPLDRRTGIAETELAYSPEAAREQSSRCLRCNVQTVFNGDLCVLCGGCVDVCPQNCYKMVSLDAIEGDEKLQALVRARYGLPLDRFHEGQESADLATALIKDEARCVRCGLCAKRCPMGAITMESFWYQEELLPANGDKEAAGLL